MRLLGRIFGVLRLEVSGYNVYVTNQFQAAFAREGGGWGVGAGYSEKQGGKLSRLLSNFRPRIRPLVVGSFAAMIFSKVKISNRVLPLELFSEEKSITRTSERKSSLSM